MEFKIEVWTIKQLLDLLDKKKLNLNPPYQRNPIWTKSTQKYLVNSIKSGMPIPNLFLYEYKPGLFEMVDGQQRTRALRLYSTTNELNVNDNDDAFKVGEFLNYLIPVTTITKLEPHESVEEFYYMVNSSGVHLNRPETLKAQHFNTNFLRLVEDLTFSNAFQKLEIVPASAQKRMLDRDLVEELCALILHGITDKKTQVDKIYVNDIDANESQVCQTKFNQVLSILDGFDKIEKLKNTRYRQRNDLYTMFSFLKDNLSIPTDTLNYFYRVLCALQKGIKPSRSACLPLAEYAYNCITQTNSSTARQKRLEIINQLLLNPGDTPTVTQAEVMIYYPAEGPYFIKNGGYLSFDPEILKRAIEAKEVTE